MSNTLAKVAIVGYNRIPFAKVNTAYKTVGNREMLLATLNNLVERYSLQGIRLGEVAGGAVIKHSTDGSLVRETVMKTLLDPATPAFDLQKACVTGMEATIAIANKIALGQIDSGIACGVDSASDLPLSLSDHLRHILLTANQTSSLLHKIKIFSKLKLRDLKPQSVPAEEPETGLTMGGHTEVSAKYYQISREEQDAFALASHTHLATAYEEGFFDDMITPFMGVTKDNILRADTTIEKLARLKPAFDHTNGTLTAGNSTPFTDGASCILLANEQWAKEKNLPVLAYITYAQTAAIEYVHNRHNLLLAPVSAANYMLQKANLSFNDFDFFEIHEAFAAQTLATIKIWESGELSKQFGFDKPLGSIDRTKLNIKGSSLAAGHPFAATATRIVATLAKLLHQKGSGKGFISVCAARGQGTTMILEK